MSNHSGICDGCGQFSEHLREINGAPIAGASICEKCSPSPEPAWRAALRSLICVRLNEHGPQTNPELANGCGLPVGDIAPRMSELESGGLIYCHGLRKSASGRGRPMKVWALIQQSEK